MNTPSPASLVAPQCPVFADEIAEYRKRNSKSDALYQEARQFLAGGNSRLTAFFRPFPFYVERGEGYLLYDVDGNSRIDFYNNASSLILGHAHPAVTAALTEQAVRGTAFTHPTSPEIELARLLAEEIPSLDQLRFTNSGTEAVAMAIRAARSFTGKSKIAKMEGAYHGTSDLMSVSETTDLAHAGPADSPLAVPSSAGLTANTLAEVVVVPFNDCDAAKQIIESHRDDLAAVIVEPAMANIGYVSATPEFLGTLRKECDGIHTLLIFDEVQTLRLGTGGLQALAGVIPDLTCLGKIIGGGLPVGAFGGRTDIMHAFDAVEGHPKIPHGGTFNANPMTMQAGLAALHELNEVVYARLNDLGESLRERLASEAAERNVPIQVTGIGSFFGIHFIENPVVDYRSARKQNAALRERLFFFLLNRGNLPAQPTGRKYLHAHGSGSDRSFRRSLARIPGDRIVTGIPPPLHS